MTMAAREFQVFAKRGGAVYNLRCRYCYYLDKKNLYAGEGNFLMADDLLEAYIVRHMSASPSPVINFAWHGGVTIVLSYSRIS